MWHARAAVFALVAFLSSSVFSATQLSLVPLSLCPYTGSSPIEQKTKASSPGGVWTGVPRTINQTCPSPNAFSPAPQSIKLGSSDASSIIEANAAKSGLYSLVIFRSSTVGHAYVSFKITDAAGKELVPKTDLALSPPTYTSGRRKDQVEFQSAGERVAAAGHHALAAGPSRRLLKGSGGGGGGGRGGGGSGGFKSSGGSGGGRSYGYSSSALGSRYPGGGYTRTGYGYSGRGYYGGYPMVMVMPMYGWGYGYGYHGYGYHRNGHYSGCDKYSGSDKTACQTYYGSKCTVSQDNKTTTCTTKSQGDWTRDDIMAATFDASKATYPVTVTFLQVVAGFKTAGSAPPEWNQPMSFALSEVDYDDEDDNIGGMIVLIIVLIIVGGCVIAGICFCCHHCNKSGQHYDNHHYHDDDATMVVPMQSYPNTGGSIQGYPAAAPAFQQGKVEPNLSYASPYEAQAPLTSTENMPEGWQSVQEMQPGTTIPTGRVYYHNTLTDETSWTCPTAESAPQGGVSQA